MSPGRRAAGLCTAALVLLVVLAALGDSAAVPGLGPRTPHPPWDLAAGASSALVTVLGVLAYATGGLGVWFGLRAIRDGARPDPRRLLVAGIGVAFALTLVPPAGSADHLSYLAYGRIAAAGQDAYSVAPGDWLGGSDPVAGAVQPPWRDTPSVYGPVATAAFAGVARLGDGSLRLTTWIWSLLCAAAFAAVALLLHRLLAADDAARRRAAVLWTVNPLLLGQLVLGAHLDVLAAAASMLALALAVRHPAPAGALLGAAVAIKAPYALFGLALLWGARRLPESHRWRTLSTGVFGAALVLVPAHVLAGPHVFDQLRTASGFTSIASPWRAVVNLIELGTGSGSLRPVVVPLALLVAGGLAWLLRRRVMPADEPDVDSARDSVLADAARAALVLTAAWVLCAPYALPWYDAMVWAPLALVAAPVELAGLEAALLARLVVLSLAYLPGRVIGLSPAVETTTLGFRRYVAPVLVLSAVLSAVRWARAERRRPSPVP